MQTKTKIENISQSVRETANEPFGFQVKQPPIHSHSAVATRGQGRRSPPNDCLCPPHFGLLKAEVESRTQGLRPRRRTQKKSEAKAKDSLSEDRHSRGQGQECSRPRTKDTSACALQKKKGLLKNFSSDLLKKTFSKNFFKRFTKF